MGGLLGAGAVRTSLGDRVRHVSDAASPRRAAKRRPNRVHQLVALAVGTELDGRIGLLEVAEGERRVVAVELDTFAILRRSPDVEAAREPHDGSAVELDGGNDEIRAADAEGRAVHAWSVPA